MNQLSIRFFLSTSCFFALFFFCFSFQWSFAFSQENTGENREQEPSSGAESSNSTFVGGDTHSAIASLKFSVDEALSILQSGRQGLVLSDSNNDGTYGDGPLIYRLRSNKNEISTRGLDIHEMKVEIVENGIDEMYRNFTFEDILRNQYHKDPRLFREHLNLLREKRIKDHDEPLPSSLHMDVLRHMDLENFAQSVNEFGPSSVGLSLNLGPVGVSISKDINLTASLDQSTREYMGQNQTAVFSVAEFVRKTLFSSLNSDSKDQLLNGYGSANLPPTKMIRNHLEEEISFNELSLMYPIISNPYIDMKNTQFVENLYQDLTQRDAEFKFNQELLIKGQKSLERILNEQINRIQVVVEKDQKISIQILNEVEDVRDILLSTDPELTKLNIRLRGAEESLTQINKRIRQIESSNPTQEEREELGELKIKQSKLSNNIKIFKGSIEKVEKGRELQLIKDNFNYLNQNVTSIEAIANLIGIENTHHYTSLVKGHLQIASSISQMATLGTISLTGLGGIATGLNIMMSASSSGLDINRVILNKLNEIYSVVTRIESKVDQVQQTLESLINLTTEYFQALNRNLRNDFYKVQEQLQGLQTDIFGNRRFIEILEQEEIFRELMIDIAGVLGSFSLDVGSRVYRENIACQIDENNCSESAKNVMNQIKQIMGKIVFVITDLMRNDLVFKTRSPDYFENLSVEKATTYFKTPIENRTNLLLPIGAWLNNKGELFSLGQNVSIQDLQDAIHPGFLAVLTEKYVQLAMNLPGNPLIQQEKSTTPIKTLDARSFKQKGIDKLCNKAIDVHKAIQEMRDNLPFAWSIYKKQLNEVKTNIYDFFITQAKEKFQKDLAGHMNGDYLFSSDKEIEDFVNALERPTYYVPARDHHIWWLSRDAYYENDSPYVFFAIDVGAYESRKYGCSYRKNYCAVEFKHNYRKLNICFKSKSSLLNHDYSILPVTQCIDKIQPATIFPKKHLLISHIKKVRNQIFSDLKENLRNHLNGINDTSHRLIRDLTLAKLALETFAYGGYGKHFIDFYPQFQKLKNELKRAPSGHLGITLTKTDTSSSTQSPLAASSSPSQFKKWMKWVEGRFQISENLPLDASVTSKNLTNAVFTHTESGQNIDSSLIFGFGEPFRIYRALERVVKYPLIRPEKENCIKTFNLSHFYHKSVNSVQP